MKTIILLLVILSQCFAEKPVNYANTLIKWERRELECEASVDGKNPGVCKLHKDKNSEPYQVTCSFDKGKSRSSCDIECVGADRDSVISKSPHWNHRCVRFYSYDSQLDEASGKWFIWRSDQCLLEKISLEVHCGFP